MRRHKCGVCGLPARDIGDHLRGRLCEKCIEKIRLCRPSAPHSEELTMMFEATAIWAGGVARKAERKRTAVLLLRKSTWKTERVRL